ncbi:addiction module antidote protein [Endozoicomonas ascidiicola]|uniref:addiction module antidote protein n=1 Tax=Endozoicomonas ascidiicola TaxID=1698521 RepID=UPI00082E168A|nr:addiction module antidote protein [Endozoicomonas ascidiicola]
MGEKLTPFNPVELLQGEDEIAEFLSEAYLDEDPNVFIIALGHVAKYKGISNLAKETGLNRESLYKTFSGTVQPKWDTIHRLLRALKVRLAVAS